MTNNRIKMTNYFSFPNKWHFIYEKHIFFLRLSLQTQSTDLRTYSFYEVGHALIQNMQPTQTTNKTPENQIVLTVVSLTYTLLHFITSYLSISSTSIIYSFIFHWQKPFRLCWCSKASSSNLIFSHHPLFGLTQTSKQLITHNTNKLQAF